MFHDSLQIILNFLAHLILLVFYFFIKEYLQSVTTYYIIQN